MKNIAVILAGGVGQRLGYNIPKQFLKVAGKKVIEHTLDVFQKNELIDEIAVVSHPDYISYIEDIAIKGEYPKLKKILNGGQERYHSSLSAIKAYDEDVNLIFHDSVRPLVNDRIINDCIQALQKYDAVDVAIKTTDTIISVGSESFIDSIPQRSLLRNGQTPQAFKKSVIERAYELALQDPDFITTDDCGVVLKYLPEVPIYVVDGEQFNIKLTYKEDLFLLDKLFQLKMMTNVDKKINENALQLNNKVIVVLGGSYGIGSEIVDICKELGAKVYSFSRSSGVDVSNYNALEDAFKKVYQETGRIDCVVNTAGVLDKQPLGNMSFDEIVQSVQVNYTGVIFVAKVAYPYLKETQGSLLLFTSSSYTRGRALYSIYSSSKAGVVNLTQALSEEWSDLGIKINCINPERTATPMRTKSFGIEPADTLLDAKTVAIASVNTLASKVSGEIVDVKLV